MSEEVFSERPLRLDQQRVVRDAPRAGSSTGWCCTNKALNGLVRRQHDIVDPVMLPYWQDLYDHVIVVNETTDSLRDLVSSLVDANLSLRDYRQNLVMKKVSSWAAIVAAPTLVTGYYGMNVPFPGSGETEGVVVSSLVIVAMSLALYVLFRRRDWL